MRGEEAAKKQCLCLRFGQITNDDEELKGLREPWKFCIEERVRWGDVDAARIIFYGAYIRFFEFAETELFRAVGLPYSRLFDQLDIWLPRVHLECDFHRAAQLDDLLEVAVYVGHFGRKSLRLDFEVRREGEEPLIATAHFVLVAVRRDTMKSVVLPEELKRRLARYAHPSTLTSELESMAIE
ncbi:thioesterase family protein [Pyrinomonas sp.]|uniref:acyl-CoA thioesterase n=1 Tax=Pyrinomonas sp. TaxID=2080306 RepID=UPI00332CD3EB